MTSALDVLGVFPSFESGAIGGVQESGREAWRAIVGRIGDNHARALHYQAGQSKAGVVVRALASRARADVVLVWHLHLLKLLPVLDHSAARVVLFLHGVEAWRRLDPLSQFLLRRVDLFLSNSDCTWRKFLACNPDFAAANHQTVHLGTGAALAGEEPVPVAPPAVLMLGRIDRREDYKGHREMIGAWPLVRERVPDAELWIAGDGDLRPTLEDLVSASGLGGCVRFHGRVDEGEKARLLAGSRCLAMPSRGEGFGLVYLEAMRVGRPCLVSTLDAGVEVVEPPAGGLAVDPADAEAIARAVEGLVGSSAAWPAIAARARRRYESRFTAEHFHQRLLSAVFGA